MKGKVKKGVVKCIDRETLRVILLGPVGEKGYYLEKRVNVHCVSYFENKSLKKQAFEHLRTRLVGEKVEFEDYKMGKDTNADLFLDKRNIGFELVVKGLAKPIRLGDKTSKYYDDLKMGEKKAQEDKVGIFAKIEEDDNEGKTRKERREKKRSNAPVKAEELKGKTVSGYVDNVNFNLSFKLWVEELNRVVDANFAWVKTPVIKKEHVTKLKNWMSKNIFQRNFKFKITGFEDDVMGIVETEGKIESLMLKSGWSRLESEAASEMPAEQFSTLREAQDEAQTKGLRIWKGFKKKNKGKQIKSEKWPLKKRIEVKVVEVHNGDAITVQEPSGERLRIFFTNLKSPKYNWADADKSPSWSFEAREFTRTSLVKKKVGLEMDVRKVIIKEEEKKEIIINAGTVFLKDKPFGVELLERGFAELNIVRGSEDLSSALKSYTYANEKAKKMKKGIYGKKSARKSYWDYSKPENKKKLKSESNLEPGENRIKAVVERCISASRIKLRLDSEGCFIIFVLNSVKSIRGNKNMSALEKWFENGQTTASDLIAQRDVNIEIENIDNVGNVHGSLFVGKKNYAVKILDEGVAYLDTTWGKCRYHSDMEKAEENARSNKNGFWQDEAVVMTLGLGREEDEDDEAEGDLLESKAPKKKSTKKELKGELSECESADLFYMQRSGSSQMKAVLKYINEGHRKCPMLEAPVSLKTLCIALFEGEYHRCRVISKGSKNSFKVFFIDWGNYGYVQLSDMKTCPKKAMNILPQARAVTLAHIRIPHRDQEFGFDAIDWIQDKLTGKKVNFTQLSKKKGVATVEIYLNGKGDQKKSLNYMMCVDGLALPNMDNTNVSTNPVWQEANKKALKANSELNRVLNEEY